MSEDLEAEPERQPRRPRQAGGVPPKTLLLLLVALGCGLAAAFLTNQLVDGNLSKTRESKMSGLLVPVVVAKKDIPAGTIITDPVEFFRVAYYRGGDEPRGAVQGLDGLKDKVIVRALAEDQPVKEQDISAK